MPVALRNQYFEGFLPMYPMDAIKTMKEGKIYWVHKNDILYALYQAITPLVNVIDDNMDYDQTKNPDTPEAFINCVQMALKLFSFDIEEFKKVKKN